MNGKTRIAWCNLSPGRRSYVASKPLRSGKKREDWGYTDKQEDAIPLSESWQLRFASDMNNVRRIYGFILMPED